MKAAKHKNCQKGSYNQRNRFVESHIRGLTNKPHSKVTLLFFSGPSINIFHTAGQGSPFSPQRIN